MVIVTAVRRLVTFDMRIGVKFIYFGSLPEIPFTRPVLLC